MRKAKPLILSLLLILIIVGFNTNFVYNADAADQCNYTSECKQKYGSSATDCKNSRTNNSICMCGAVPCEDGNNDPGNPDGGNPNPPVSTDQCDYTSECKEKFGSWATDCKNSRSNNSVCMCGAEPCEEGNSDPGNTGGGSTIGRFNTGKDLLLMNFDCKPDVDDLHSVAAYATMFSHPKFKKVKYHATMGTVGKQGGQFIGDAQLFKMAFGNNWSNANWNWWNAVNKASEKAIQTLRKGGKVFITEAGQSDFSADVIRKIKNRMPNLNTKSRITLVQHHPWNESTTTNSDLNYVKKQTTYKKIDDGNKANGSPDFQTTKSNLWGRVEADADVGRIWKRAHNLAKERNGRGHTNQAIKANGMDFSDAVEGCWVFKYEWINDVGEFFGLFL